MKINSEEAIAIIAVAAICTFSIRAIPFVLFGGKKEIPKLIRYLGDVLPPGIMAILIVYCLKSAVFQGLSASMAAFLSVLMVVVVHLWKKNTLISISAGTICYMLLIRTIFK